MPNRTKAICAFLHSQTLPDIASRYSDEMECQVNVAQDNGEPIEGEFKDKKWRGWQDEAGNVWKPFRIPWKADTEPEYVDSDMSYDLAIHAESIGMTGWNWKQKISCWVAFDFDAIIGHSDKHATRLTQVELETVKEKAKAIPWVTIRKSTSGKGLHLYVDIPHVATANHNEHAALARAILDKLSALANFDFQSKVDICGGNMWVWARKMKGTDGLTLIKQGSPIPLEEIPKNWRDHLDVISGKRRRNLPHFIPEDLSPIFLELSGQRAKIPLGADHFRLIDYLEESKACWWWDKDHHMLVCHTANLKEAHESLVLKGIFDTVSTGREQGHDHNCFCYPLRRGAWVVRRYSKGTSEHDSWSIDASGWTRAYLNKDPDLQTASGAFGGIEDTKGGFVFRECETAHKAAQILGVDFEFPMHMSARETILRQHKDGRLVIEIKQEEGNPEEHQKMAGWLAKRGYWTRIFRTQLISTEEPDFGNFDDIVRHMVTSQDENAGWGVKRDGMWGVEPLTHIRAVLTSLGYNLKDSTGIIGGAIFKPWKLVNIPFEPEYPGDRQWNRNAAQLRFLPSSNSTPYTPTWDKVLNHCGAGLNSALAENPWARVNGIKTGAEYLRCWIASLFQEPLEPIPYLFFFGPEAAGKSMFHESLQLLVTKGYKKADSALVNQGSFNAELEGSLICVVEEINLSKSSVALNRIKDWVTARDILIHKKGETPYHAPNTTKWIQCANSPDYCPVFPGDTRITMIYVQSIDVISLIPKRDIITELEKEAPDFINGILKIEVPPSTDRLNVPVIHTGEKKTLQLANETSLEAFLREKCVEAKGQRIKLSEFGVRFHDFLEATEAGEWSLRRITKVLPQWILKGNDPKTNQVYLGNVWWSDKDPLIENVRGRYVLGGSTGAKLTFVPED
jgi:hypothetical protein